MSDLQTTLQNIIADTKAKRQGGSELQWLGHCPCSGHSNGDQNPSLSISADAEKILLYCFSTQRSGDDLASFLNVEPKQLFKQHNNASGQSKTGTAVKSGLTVQPMNTFEKKEIRWILEPLVPQNFFTLVDGVDGIGKTFIFLWLASELSKAGRRTLWFSNEDAPEYILKPRLEKLGADCSKIDLVTSHFSFDNESEKASLRELLDRQKYDLVVFDPLMSYTGRLATNNGADVRTVTDYLGKTADAYECAVVGIRHLNKAKGFGDERNAGTGSHAWRDGSRSALIVHDADDKNNRGVYQAKLSFGKESKQVLGYEITDDGVFEWLKDTDLTPERMLAFKTQEDGRKERPTAKLDAAKEFLMRALAQGPRDYNELWSEARACENFSLETLKDAGRELGVEKTCSGFQGTWKWDLPRVCSQSDTLHTLDDDFTKTNENGRPARVCSQSDTLHTLGSLHTLETPENDNKPVFRSCQRNAAIHWCDHE